MKKISVTMLLILAFIASASAQQIEKIFDKYMEDERFQYIYDGSDIDKVNRQGWKNNGEKMLMLNVAQKALMKTFSDEVDAAVKADGYKNTTFVRNGTNKVTSYIRQTPNKKDEVTFIQNGDTNITFIWESFSK
jgi:hypothetical protein